MRRVLGACLVVTLLGLAVLPMAGPTAAQQAVRGGTLTFATGADPTNLDPQNTQSNPGEQVNRMMHENLVRFSAKMQLESALAESWVAVEGWPGVDLQAAEGREVPRRHLVRRQKP